MAPERRYADYEAIDLTSPPPSPKRQRASASSSQKSRPSSVVSKPKARYKQHVESGVGKEFHSVPYPLSLLPKKTWEALNNGDETRIFCSQCGKERVPSVHQRKLFLVAERLSWEIGATSGKQREQNEVNTWAVNAELGIFDPVVDEDEVVIGGRRSRAKEYYPYNSREEADAAMMVVERSDILSEASWPVWLHTVDSKLQELQRNKTEGEGIMDRYGRDPSSQQARALHGVSPNTLPRRTSPRKKAKSPVSGSSSLPTPPSSGDSDHSGIASMPVKCSFRTLQQFYSLLDKLERTSPQGARYLEAYAEQLHKDGCRDCWFKKTIVDLPDWLDLDFGDEGDDEEDKQEKEETVPEHSRQFPKSLMPTASKTPTYPSGNYPAMPPHLQGMRSQPLPQGPPLPLSGHALNTPPSTNSRMVNSLNPRPHALPPGMYPRNPLLPPQGPTSSAPPGRAQVNQVPTAPPPCRDARYAGPVAWLQHSFVYDPAATVGQFDLWTAFSQFFAFLQPSQRVSSNELFTSVLPLAFTMGIVQTERLPNGLFVVRGIRPDLQRNPQLFSTMPPNGAAPPPPGQTLPRR